MRYSIELCGVMEGIFVLFVVHFLNWSHRYFIFCYKKSDTLFFFLFLQKEQRGESDFPDLRITLIRCKKCVKAYIGSSEPWIFFLNCTWEQ